MGWGEHKTEIDGKVRPKINYVSLRKKTLATEFIMVLDNSHSATSTLVDQKKCSLQIKLSVHQSLLLFANYLHSLDQPTFSLVAEIRKSKPLITSANRLEFSYFLNMVNQQKCLYSTILSVIASWFVFCRKASNRPSHYAHLTRNVLLSSCGTERCEPFCVWRNL